MYETTKMNSPRGSRKTQEKPEQYRTVASLIIERDQLKARSMEVGVFVGVVLLCLCLAYPFIPASSTEPTKSTSAFIQTKERCLSYNVAAQLQEFDNSLFITETFELDVKHELVKSGIYRKLPTRIMLPSGNEMTLSYSRIGVTRTSFHEHPDGIVESFPLEQTSEKNLLKLQIGDPEKKLEKGRQVFELAYQVTGAVVNTPEGLTVRWPVNGELPFAIDTLQFALSMPSHVLAKAHGAPQLSSFVQYREFEKQGKQARTRMQFKKGPKGVVRTVEKEEGEVFREFIYRTGLDPFSVLKAEVSIPFDPPHDGSA